MKKPQILNSTNVIVANNITGFYEIILDQLPFLSLLYLLLKHEWLLCWLNKNWLVGWLINMIN